MSQAVITSDLTTLATRLRNAASEAPRATETVLDDVAQKVYDLMVDKAPVLTGALRASITIVSLPGRRVIGPQGLDYAAYQEFGTGIRGEFPGEVYIIKPKKGDFLVFEVAGEKVFAREVRHPGIPPNPFVRPAGREALENVGATFAEMGADLIRKGA